MNMKQHILAALSEVRDGWEEVLASLSAEQIASLPAPPELPARDVIAHLWAWQQRSIARMEAALLNREPEFPHWIIGVDPDDYANTDQVNAWLYRRYRDVPWAQVYHNWQAGFRHFLASADGIPEPDLLSDGKYLWLKGYPLACTLLGTYDHHQEHLEKFQAWLREHTDPGRR